MKRLNILIVHIDTMCVTTCDLRSNPNLPESGMANEHLIVKTPFGPKIRKILVFSGYRQLKQNLMKLRENIGLELNSNRIYGKDGQT